MHYQKWKEMLGNINSTPGLNYYNIIVIIKGELRIRHREIYIKWRESQFNINYSFPFQSGSINNESTLLHISAYYGLENVVNALLAVEGVYVNAVDKME